MTGRRYTRPVRRLRGLTLLEVLVAMTLLAVGIVAALGAISACVRSSDAASGYSRGALFAGQVAAELERSESLEPGNLNGMFDDLATDYTWTADIDQPDEQGLYPALITVYWQNGQRQYRLTTMLHPRQLQSAPAAAPPAPGPPEGGSG